MRLVAGGPGIGDGIVLTGVVAHARAQRPDEPIEVVVAHPELWAGNPWGARVKLWDNAWNERSFPEFDGLGQGSECGGEHIIQTMCRKLGLVVPTRADARPHVRAYEPRSAWPGKPRYVTVHCQAGNWTVNRDWPIGHWAKLVRRLREADLHVVQIGASTDPVLATDDDHRGCSLRRTATLLRYATVHVGPISGTMHLAAAVDTRASVIVFGGREDPTVIAYDQQLVLIPKPGGLGCTPCWHTQPCPYGRNVEFEWRKPCMDWITVRDVADAVVEAATLEGGVHGVRYID